MHSKKSKSGIICDNNSRISEKFPDVLQKSGIFWERGGEEKRWEKLWEKLPEKLPERLLRN